MIQKATYTQELIWRPRKRKTNTNSFLRTTSGKIMKKGNRKVHKFQGWDSTARREGL